MGEGQSAERLYDATVPVFLQVLDRLEAMLDKARISAGGNIAVVLATRPAEGMFPASQQIATAIQFMLRIVFPLIGQRTPELRGAMDADGLAARIAAARGLLQSLPPAAFDAAETRRVRAIAGFADLDLSGEALLYEFGLPNLYFHQSMAYVALKQAGVPLGKADFDGLHNYPEGFAFG